MRLKTLAFAIALALGINNLFAQDLLSMLNDETPEKEFVKNAFKSTRVINSHSLELAGEGVLDFRILHRFGRVNGGAYEAFGFDQARIRLAFDYGISKRLMIGIGRSSYKKEADGFIKYRLLWQAKGKNASPVSAILVAGITDNLLKWEDNERKNYASSRLGYYYQVILGRKFSERFSLQIAPTLVHTNLVKTTRDKNDVIAVGTGARLKLSKRVAVTLDYYYQLPGQLPDAVKPPLSIGVDIETGGHVFQLHFTNALGMNERVLITETDGHWEKGDIHIGFNISRVFTVKRKK
jgi:Membrane bound beta barrel domain (DUF5777)